MDKSKRSSSRNEGFARIADGLLLLSIVAFVVCLPFSAYTVSGNGYVKASASAEILAGGWLGIFTGMFEWFANPFLWASWRYQWKSGYRSGLVCSGISLALALGFLVRSRIIVNEAGHYGDIVSKDIGYWVWIVSILLSLLGNFLASRSNRRHAAT